MHGHAARRTSSRRSEEASTAALSRRPARVDTATRPPAPPRVPGAATYSGKEDSIPWLAPRRVADAKAEALVRTVTSSEVDNWPDNWPVGHTNGLQVYKTMQISALFLFCHFYELNFKLNHCDDSDPFSL